MSLTTIVQYQRSTLGPTFSLPLWLVVPALLPTGMLAGAVFLAAGDSNYAEFAFLVLGGAIIRHFTMAGFVSLSALAVPTRSTFDRSERLTATYLGHAIVGVRDLVVVAVMMATADPMWGGYAAALIDPFLLLGCFASGRFLTQLGWKSSAAVATVAILWAPDIVARIFYSLFFVQ